MKRYALILAMCLAAGCGTAPPPPSGTTGPLVPSPAATSAPADSTGSAGPGASPAVLVPQATLPATPVIALAPATDGHAWFLGRGSPGGVGSLSASGIAHRAPTGPAPVAVAGAKDVFVVEGRSDTGAASARSEVLERLDPATLAVVSSVRLPELVTGIATVGDSVWLIATDGTVTAYEATTLTPTFTAHLDGVGPASISATADTVWAAIGKVTDAGVGQYAIACFDAASHARTDMVVAGDGVSPVIAAGGRRAWLAYPDGDVADRLAVSDGGDFVAIGQTAAPAGMVIVGDRVWSASIDGAVETMDGSSGAVLGSYTGAGGGTAITAADGSVFVGLGRDVVIFAAP